MGKMFIERTVYQEKNARIVILQDNNKRLGSPLGCEQINTERIYRGQSPDCGPCCRASFQYSRSQTTSKCCKNKDWVAHELQASLWLTFSTTFWSLLWSIRDFIRSDDGDGNGNATKAIGLISKTTILHVTARLCSHCTTATWKCLISRCTEEVHKRPRNFLSALGYVS